MSIKFKQYVTEAEKTGVIAQKVKDLTEKFVVDMSKLTEETKGVEMPAGEGMTSNRTKYSAIRDQMVLVEAACNRLIDVAAQSDAVLDKAMVQQS